MIPGNQAGTVSLGVGSTPRRGRAEDLRRPPLQRDAGRKQILRADMTNSRTRAVEDRSRFAYTYLLVEAEERLIVDERRKTPCHALSNRWPWRGSDASFYFYHFRFRLPLGLIEEMQQCNLRQQAWMGGLGWVGRDLAGIVFSSAAGT